MWEPDPSWRPLVGGPGSAGLWRVQEGERAWVLKRLPHPGRGEPWLERPDHAGYWQREAEVARNSGLVDGPGLVPPAPGGVEEDDEGLTVRFEEVVGLPPPGLFVARALGRFAAAAYEVPGWASRHVLADRLEMAGGRGGWPTLARTTLADVTDHLWQRRGHWLSRLEAAPQGRLHGDAVPGNFLASRGEEVVAVDWQCTGVGPIGTDLGYYALSSRESFEVLLATFLDGVRAEQPDLGTGAAEAVEVVACVTAVYSVLSRAEWALAHVARGEGALVSKFRHPAVSPHLRAVERQFPQIERLLV